MDENKDNLNNEFGDSMFSSDGNDSMFSSSGNDSMFSNNENDSMFSNDEDDSMFSTKNEDNSSIIENNTEDSMNDDKNSSTENLDTTSIPSIDENNEKIIDVEEIVPTQTPNEEDEILSKEENKNLKPKKEDMGLRFEEIDENTEIDDTMVTVRPVRFQEFDEPSLNLTIKKNLDIMQDVPMHITVELGRTKSTIKEIINMEIGSIVELDKIAGEQVEIFVNEKLVARGEVIVIEDKFGVRVVNTNIPKENF